MSDIARLASVHASTVSAVLAGKAQERRISPEAAKRVYEAAAQMDFVPNVLSRSLKRGRTHVLSFFDGFRSRVRRNYYIGVLTTAVERAAGELDYDVEVCCNFRRSAVETYRHLNGGRCDGLIFFAPQVTDPLLPLLRHSRLPVVLLNSVDEAGTLSSVAGDQTKGMRLVGDQLAALGHRRIAAFVDEDQNSDSPIRLALLRARLAEHGLDIPDRWVLPQGGTRQAEGEAALRFLMSEPEPPTAIFCWNDHVGYMILEVCDRLGIDVPEHLSLVGYDGLRWPVRTRHTLASVVVDLEMMGEAAVEVLDKLIGQEKAAPVKCVLPVHLDPGTTLCHPRENVISRKEVR